MCGVGGGVLQAGDPRHNNAPACQYSRLDFESSAEFRRFYGTLRNRTMELIRSLAEAHVRAPRPGLQVRARARALSDGVDIQSPPGTPGNVCPRRF